MWQLWQLCRGLELRVNGLPVDVALEAAAPPRLASVNTSKAAIRERLKGGHREASRTGLW